MLRRDTRLRQEYLYRKSLEGKRAEEYEKRLAVRTAIEQGKPIPTELRETEAKLRDIDSYKDTEFDKPKTHIDDEYKKMIEDPENNIPRIVLTTSRSPSSRLGQFAKEMKLMFPNCQRLNRGSLLINELILSCRANNFTDLIIVHETRGEPDGLIISHLPYGPTAYFNLKHCVMRHDVKQDQHIPPVSEAFPNLIFHQFNSKLALRLQQILKYLFPVPKSDSKRLITFANFDDTVSFRHHTYVKNGKSKDDVQLTEIGPRFEMALYQIKLGTIDQDEADNEWVLRPYMRTAKHRKALG